MIKIIIQKIHLIAVTYKFENILPEDVVYIEKDIVHRLKVLNVLKGT